MPRLWKPPHPAPSDLLFDLLDVPPFIVQTLYNRGLQTPQEIRSFVSLEDVGVLHDPLALRDMDAALSRVRSALTGQERIAVYADFDVDGVCSAALLMSVFQQQGAAAQVYIPHRVEEGYGLNKRAIARLADDGVRLLITADCGTSSIDEIAYARGLNMDVIVTDHHHVHGVLPPAAAVLNPHRPDSVYPFRELAGVGVAYKLAQALAKSSSVSVQSFMDLVAVGTVVDVAPLVGENRTLVRLGLKLMRQSPRLGLKALMQGARIKPETVDTGSLGFAIGPRLNAAGRLDSAKTSYDLLMCTTTEQAEPLAQQLEEQNQERQKLLEQALMTARHEAAAQAQEGALIFVASETYAAGIVGLVAGRLAEEFYRPAIAVERGEEISRGSCRSVPDFHIAQALDECHDLLERHGGHAQAAGFTVRSEALGDLRKRLSVIAQRELADRPLQPVIAIDCLIPASQANSETLSWLKRMEPFGPGNPAPVFQTNNLLLKEARPVRNGHLSLKLGDGRVTWDAIAFRQANTMSDLRVGDRVDVAYNLEEREWLGERSIQLVVKDLHKR